MRGSPGADSGRGSLPVGAGREPAVAFVVARTGSTRLPGKVLRRVQSATLLEHLVRRVQPATSLDRIVCATTDLPEDDAIEAEARRLGVDAFRGPARDVPGRLLLAAGAFGAEILVLVEGDEQLVEARTVDAVVARARASGAGFVRATGQPLGAWVCAIRRDALALLCAERGTEDLDGWSAFFEEDPRVVCATVPADPAIAAVAETLRFSLDYPEDLALLEAVYARLHREGEVFGLDEVVELMAREPELAALNASRVDAYRERLERRREESVP